MLELTDIPGNDGRAKTQSLRRNKRIHWTNSHTASFKIVPDGCIVCTVVSGKWLNGDCLGQLRKFYPSIGI